MRQIRIRHPEGWKSKPYICLSVSCGKAYHEKEDFAAAVACAKSSGRPVIIDLSDTLQRFNIMAFGVDPETAAVFAKKQGDQWLERNGHLLDHCKVIRWDNWLLHPEYKKVRQQVTNAINENPCLQEALLLDVKKFVARQKTKAPDVEETSKGFLIEEAACETLLGRTYPCSRLYPGRELDILYQLRTGGFSSVPEGLDQTNYYRFTLETKMDDETSMEALA